MSKKQKYGPYTAEIEPLLPKLTALENKEVLIALKYNLRSRTTDYRELRELRAAAFGNLEQLKALAQRADRSKELQALWTQNDVGASDVMVAAALSALLMQDLVGQGWLTQERYDQLTSYLTPALAVIDSAEPNSPLRELVCNLVRDGLNVNDAIRTAKGALLT